MSFSFNKYLIDMISYIVLTVVRTGNNSHYAFQAPKEYFKVFKKCKKLFFDNEAQLIEIENGLKTYRKNGRITHSIINEWIIEKNMNYFRPRYPVKLIFKFSNINNTHRYMLYLAQGNRL